MDTTSPSNVLLPKDAVLTCIDISIRDLNELRNIFLQREEIPPQGIPVDMEQRIKARRIQYSVVDQIKGLEKVFKNIFQFDQIMEDAAPDTSFGQQGRTVVEADQAVPMLVLNPAETKESAGQLKSGSCMNESDTKEPRYLCIYDGLVICVLELKPRKHQSYDCIDDIPPLRKSATCRLMDTGFPIAAGDVPELKYPKIWPVIEEIDGRLHVIDSIPNTYPKFMAAETGMFSHEVLNADDLGQGWTRIKTTDAIGEGEIVCSHLVVGNRIYSTTSDDYMMFDNATDKWEAHPIEREGVLRDPFRVEHVLHILELGNGRCVGKFLPSVEPLFIVIALVQNIPMLELSVHVVAYLVSPTGRVLCFQRLPHFFENEQSGLRPGLYRAGTVIRVDEQGEMMCAIVNAHSSRKFKGCCCLFINMFTVEGIADSASEVKEILNDSAPKVAVELEFVRVAVEERYVFETESDADLSTFSRVQACFI